MFKQASSWKILKDNSCLIQILKDLIDFDYVWMIQGAQDSRFLQQAFIEAFFNGTIWSDFLRGDFGRSVLICGSMEDFVYFSFPALERLNPK